MGKVSVHLKRDTLLVRGFGEDIQKNEVSGTAKSKAGRALCCPRGPAPAAPYPLPLLAGPLLACGLQRATGRGREALGSQGQAHCGLSSPPWGTICSLSMHHLLVWAVAWATGRGEEIKEQACLHPGGRWRLGRDGLYGLPPL